MAFVYMDKYDILSNLLPFILPKADISRLGLSVDDIIILRINFVDNKWLDIEIEDEYNISGASSEKTYHNFTLETLLETIESY